MKRIITSAALGAWVMVAWVIGATAPVTAQAQDHGLVTADRVTLGATLGYAFRVTDDGDLDDDANPYGLGLGARGGYTLGAGLYIGGLFQYFVGESVGNDSVNGRLNQMNIAGDVGYDIALGDRAALRPLIGFGATIAMGEVCVLGTCSEDQSDPYLLIAPGLAAVVAFDAFYVGGEARYFYLPDDNFPDGFWLGGTVGALL